MAVVSPAFIYYHLYPDSAIGQFYCYAWISVSKTIIIFSCFLVMPFYLIFKNFGKMNVVSFVVIFIIASVNFTSEFFVLSINFRICNTKFVAWMKTKQDEKKILELE